MVDALALGLEDAHSRYSQKGYPVRPLTEVFLLGTYGSTGTPAITLSGSIIINTDIDAFVNDLQYTRATAAHEFFHTIQWSFMTKGGICMWFGPEEFGIPEAWFLYEDLRWWMEATAQWAQHQVYSGPPLGVSTRLAGQIALLL